MTNYITAQEFSNITGISGEEVGELSSDTTKRDARITEAQKQFEIETSRTWTGSEDDYVLAQRAVAFLTAHLLWLRNVELLPTSAEGTPTITSPFKSEYKRILSILKQGKATDDRPVFTAGLDNVATEDLSGEYVRDSY